MSDPAAAKAAARATAFVRRKAAHEAAGPDDAARLCAVLARHRGVPLAGYLPIRTEIDPLPAMVEAAAGAPVGVPVIPGPDRPLDFARWRPGAATRPGPFDVPVPAEVTWVEPEILIVPLLAFTRAGHRLGYGGGFYDRTLALLRARRPTLAIGFAFAAQEVADLPVEPTDQTLDMVVTEREIIDIPR